MLDAIQFANSYGASDGGPARHALEVNFALNAGGVATQGIAVRRTRDSMLSSYAKRPDAPAHFPLEGRRAFKTNVLMASLKTHTWIIHGYYLAWIPCAAAIAILLGKQLLIMPHGALTAYDRRRGSFKKFVFHMAVGWWMNRATCFVVATPREAEEALQLDGISRVRVVGAGATVGTRKLSPQEPRESVQLLSMSRLAPKKRIDRIIRAVAEMRRRGINAKLTIAGGGDTNVMKELKDVITEESLVDHVSFIGQVESAAKAEIYDRSHIFLLLSEDENFGIALADALANGLPSVVTPAVAAAAGLPDDTVKVVPDPSPALVADAVQSLLFLYSERSEKASEIATSVFGWQAVGERWISAITKRDQ